MLYIFTLLKICNEKLLNPFNSAIDRFSVWSIPWMTGVAHRFPLLPAATAYNSWKHVNRQTSHWDCIEYVPRQIHRFPDSTMAICIRAHNLLATSVQVARIVCSDRMPIRIRGRLAPAKMKCNVNWMYGTVLRKNRYRPTVATHIFRCLLVVVFGEGENGIARLFRHAKCSTNGHNHN